MANNVNILIRKDKPAFQISVLSFFAQLAGIAIISSSSFIWWQIAIGIMLLIVGLFGILLKSELFFIPQKNTLEIRWQSLGLRKTQEENLPKIHYIAIVRVKTSKLLNIKSLSYNDESYKCNLNFIFQESKTHYKKLCTVDKEIAFVLAKRIAKQINKPILDYTSKDKKWIK